MTALQLSRRTVLLAALEQFVQLQTSIKAGRAIIQATPDELLQPAAVLTVLGNGIVSQSFALSCFANFMHFLYEGKLLSRSISCIKSAKFVRDRTRQLSLLALPGKMLTRNLT